MVNERHILRYEETSRSVTIAFGVDRLIADPALAGAARRIGLVTNDAARLAADPADRARAALVRAELPIVRLFGPEHGLAGGAADGASVRDTVDPLTGLEVISLYGERLRPSYESIADLDLMLFDIPDIGARFYTYIWTLHAIMDACETADVPLCVLDRPNPLGGLMADAEGPVLEMQFASFIGGEPMPIRHSLTIGELARLWQRERFPSLRLQVIACTGWARAMLWPETGLEFIPTSPAMPSFESALLYPGVCLFEATNLSVGRGTSATFQYVGAPWLDAKMILEVFAPFRTSGVRLDADRFMPTMGIHADLEISCVRIDVLDARAVRPVSLGIRLLAAIIATHRDAFSWATYPTAANPGGEGHFERLVGVGAIRQALENPEAAPRPLPVGAWTTAGDWEDRTRDILLY
jgi:uncharacterized protein YbbC (DUF1343 family)